MSYRNCFENNCQIWQLFSKQLSSYKTFENICREKTGQPFSELANQFSRKLGLRATNAEVEAAKKATLQECTRQCL